MGPRTDPTQSVSVGVGAHIAAASAGGPRYDASLTSKQRRSVENGIWLCQNHAKLVDNDTSRYTAADLREWKRAAEAQALAELEGDVTESGIGTDASIELTVGGRILGGARPPLPFKRTDDGNGTCIRHDYELTVTVRNVGDCRLNGYHVDLEFPRRALEHPEKHSAYVEHRSTRQHAFFRASGPTSPELFPGDTRTVLTLRYYVDDEILWEHERVPENRTYVKPVRVTLHRPGVAPLRVETIFEQLSNF